MKSIDMLHYKFLRLTYPMTNGMSLIWDLCSEGHQIIRQLHIWGAPEAWSHIRIPHETAWTRIIQPLSGAPQSLLHICCCWPMVDVPVHRITLGISLWHLSPHIHQSHLAIQTDQAILSTGVRIWDTGSLIRGNAAAFAGISLRFWHTSDPHPRESDAETRLGYSCLSCSFRCWVYSGLWLKFRHNWDLPIQSRMSFLDIYKANFDKLRLIMDISYLPGHASKATNKPPMRMYPSP